MVVRTSLMINAPAFEEKEIQEMVASSQEFQGLVDVFKDSRIGGFGSLSVIQDKPIETVKKEIERFFSNREHHELLLFYFSGYQLINEKGAIYFADRNVDLNALPETSIPARFVYNQIKECNSMEKIVFIDCFSQFELDEQKRMEQEERLAEFSRATNSVFITSQDTVGISHSSDGKKNPGFSESILEGLQTGNADLDGRGFITEDELFIYVHKRMNKYGTAPNLFLSDNDDAKRIIISKNIQFAKLPEFAREDSAIDFGRFFRLVGSRKELTSEVEKESFRKVIRSQPEATFLRRFVSSAITALGLGGIGGWLLGIDFGKGILLGFLIFVGMLLQIYFGRFLK